MAIIETITGTEARDTIEVSSSDKYVKALGGRDYIWFYFTGEYHRYNNITIDAGTGDDEIEAGYINSNVSINGGKGNDSINNDFTGLNVTISGGNGNDSIYSKSDNTTIEGGDGADTIKTSGTYSIIVIGGTGDDVITNTNDNADVLYKYSDGDGNDSLVGFNDLSTLQIGGGTGTYSSQQSGSDIIVTVGDGKITLVGAASLSTVNIDGTESSSSDSKLIRGTEGADSIYNTVEGATIDALGGNDYIYNDDNYYAYYSSINAGAGNDTVEGDYVASTIFGGTGNDLIKVDHTYMGGSDAVPVINGGAGSDTIISNGYGIFGSVNGGDDNDFISVDNNYGSTTINGGKGNDTIYGYINGSYGIVYQYVSGNGKDIIYNFGASDTLQIGGGSGTYSSQQSGSNIIVTVGDGKISLIGAASLSTVNIDGTESSSSDSKLIRGTEGADSINNTVEGATIEALGGNDTINNYGDSVSIDAGDGTDTIDNKAYSYYVTINAGDGNDYIYNNAYSYYVTINGDDGSDTIENYGRYVTINAGDGADYIYSGWTRYVSLTGGAGNDTLYVSSDGYNTLTGGTGSDLFWVYYDSDTIYGTDVITDYAEGDTIQIGGVAVSSIITSGNNVIIAAGNNSLRVNNAAGKVITYIDSDGTQKTYGEVPKLIRGTSGADYINNSLEGATIQALGGSDTISNDADNVSIDAGAGNDSVDSYGSQITIDAGDGADFIYSWGNNVTINAGNGNDYIFNHYYGDSSSIDAGGGDDTIENAHSYVTIKGGAGNDSIYNEGSKILFKYNSGDGNDKVYGFNEDDTLSISGGSYSTIKSGKNIIVTVGKGKISLMGAASLSAVNIDGIEEVVETNAWKLDGTTATYGTTSNTLIKITNVKSLDGLSLSGNVVTVDSKSVNGKKITLTGSGYTLALADDVTKRETKPAAWSYSNGTATYKGSYKTKGYLLSSNAKSISYYSTATTASTLATVKGVKSKKGLSLSGKVITIAKASVDAKKITLTGSGYTLALADDVTKRETKPAAWSYSNGTATYKGSYKTKGYLLSNNAKSISYYSTATTASTLASVKGAASTSGLTVSGSKITLKKSALKNKVTVSGGYEFDFASGYSTATITGTAKADTITARGTNISINAGKGDDTIKLFGKATITGGDGADTFIYNKGNDVIADYKAEDTISIASGTAATSTSGKDLILTVGTGKITVTGGTGSTVTYFDDGGPHIYQKASDTLEGVNVTKSGKVVTLTDDYGEDTFNVADLSKYKNKIITINAVKVPRGLKITANANSNSITGTNDDDKIYGLNGADTIRGGKGSDYIEGGKGADEIYGGTGSDTLWGGAGDDILAGGNGNDVFIYGNDDGHDIITDYADIDRIMILSGEKPTLAYTPLSNNMTFNIGSGSIVIENPQGQNINFIKSDGSYLHHEAVIRSAK